MDTNNYDINLDDLTDYDDMYDDKEEAPEDYMLTIEDSDCDD
jgi:hypothetical protein